MLGLQISRGSSAQAILDALQRSLAIIEFDLKGYILDANDNFCRLMGYGLADIKGKHHSLFVEPELAGSPEYRAFWDKLGRGDHDSGEYKRVTNGGGRVWIQASYNPIRSSSGKVVKIVKVAADTTAGKLRNAEFESKLAAISRVSAVIEFTPEGEIVTANENFLKAVGYRLDEVQGQHHRMFVDPNEARSDDYRAFWRKLNDGDFVTAEFKRLGKGGREVWIQASYNPVFDLDGRVLKVVKFATDVTDRVHALTEIGAGLARLAEGDLSQKLDKAFVPSLEKLRQDFNGSVEYLHGSLTRIADNTGTLTSGTRDVSSASDDLSRRTEQQAASLEETAAALDEITATVQKTAEGALHAREGVIEADEQAKKSSVVVRQAVDAMDAIATSAKRITQIIGVIDEIAFQTNLLALNAGVEAARAGDAGRGFAVVASEVRALAQRSAEAAKEIKGLISTSSTQVDQGVKLVAETGRSLDLIMAQVGTINTVVGEIAVGAREQATALQEVNTAINQMDQTTQQNAAMVEELTAASLSMSGEVDQLSGLVAHFQFGGDSGTQALRRELRKAAPHAFRAPARSAAAPRAAKGPKPVRSAVRAAAGGAAAPDWQDF